MLKHVLRRLLRAPLFTAITLITLAVGIGANTAIFSVVNSVLLKPLAYPHSDRLVAVWQTAPGLGLKQLDASPATYFTYREEGRSFEDIGIWRGGSVSVTGISEPEQVRAIYVTDGTLPVLGIRPERGRLFTRKDDSPGSPETVLLTYGYWQRRFGGDPAILGRRIIVDGAAHQVIGVLPQTFAFMNRKAALVFPFQLDRNKVFIGNFSYQCVARLKPGVTMAQASADVARMLPLMIRKFPPAPGMNRKMVEEARLGASVRPLKDDVIGDIRKVLWVLMATVGLVLLIACANVANLLLVRAEGRQQELAIRAALGAGWARIARELLFESVTLGIAGGALGLGVAYAAVGAMALLLGVVGIYGVIAYAVSQRTREIGIRMALGSPGTEVTRMFVRHGLMLTSIGVACGLIAAMLLSRLLTALLFGVSPLDPVTYSAVAVVLVAAAMLASYIPARRATRIDPIEALRVA